LSSRTDDLGPVIAVARATGIGASYDPIPRDLVDRMLTQFYGFSGRLQHIATEKDDTFLLEAASAKYLVKISSPAEALPDIELQTAAMLHVRDTAPDLPVQLPVAGQDGRFEHRLDVVGYAGRVLRVLTFLPGQLLTDARPTPAQVRDIGRTAGRLSRVLHGFTHPRQGRTLIWDLRWFDRMRPLLRHISTERGSAVASSVFEQFNEVVVPALPTLPKQVVHGDFSPYNLLVDPGVPGYVRGVIDFGDVVHTARAFDVAVGMANLLCDDPEDPWAKAVEFVAGYLEVRELSDAELRLLATCAQARVVLRILMAQWRAIEDPGRRDYLLSHSVKDWSHLYLAHAVPTPEITARMQAAAAGRHVPAERSHQS